jgi:hypothetical protein
VGGPQHPRSPTVPNPRRTRGRCGQVGGRAPDPQLGRGHRSWSGVGGGTRGTEPHLAARTCRTCPPPPSRTCPRAEEPGAAPAPQAPPTPLTSARPGPAPRRRGPWPAPLHALSPPSAPPAAPGSPPPAPSRRRPLRGHNGAAAAPLMHMHDAAPPAPPPRPEQRSPEPALGRGRPPACAAAQGAEVLRGPWAGRAADRRGPIPTRAPCPLHTFPNAASAKPPRASCSLSARGGEGPRRRGGAERGGGAKRCGMGGATAWGGTERGGGAWRGRGHGGPGLGPGWREPLRPRRGWQGTGDRESPPSGHQSLAPLGSLPLFIQRGGRETQGAA